MILLALDAALALHRVARLGLHPGAAGDLGKLLIEAAERMLVIVTTHSEMLLDSFTNECEAVVACERPGIGTELCRLDGGELASWLDEHRLGELWSLGALGANP